MYKLKSITLNTFVALGCSFVGLSLLFAVSLTCVLQTEVSAQAQVSTQTPAASVDDISPNSTGAISGPYKNLQINQGVWNDGQAALWDLNILDHYRIFGPKQRVRGYSPEQPIKFNHIIHVQKNKMDCQYCHWSVSKAAYAAIPEVETCMGCHKFVNGSNAAAQEEISKLKSYWDKGEAIPWVKVHVMPQHVNFNHKRHVKAGVACHECHGQVPNMAQVERVSSMKMGWCVSCHRERGTSIDCATCHR